MRLSRFRADDRGLTLVELMVTIFLLSIVGIIFSSVLASALRTTRNVEGAARSNDDVRLVIAQLERELRSAEQVCEPTDGASGDTLVFRMQTASGVSEVTYTLDPDKDGDSVDDGDGMALLTRSADGGDVRTVVDNVVNEFVSLDTATAQPLFTSQAAGDEPGAPSFGKVVSLTVWIDANPRDDISPKLETTEVSGRNIWNPNSGC